MIIECQNCNKKFDLEDKLIPIKGRLVQCGFCHSQWHQLPNIITSSLKEKVIDKVDISKDEVKERSINKKKKLKVKLVINKNLKIKI